MVLRPGSKIRTTTLSSRRGEVHPGPSAWAGQSRERERERERESPKTILVLSDVT
jgi:hypothetical protein